MVIIKELRNPPKMEGFLFSINNYLDFRTAAHSEAELFITHIV